MVFDLKWIKEFFYDLVVRTEDRNVILLAARYQDVLEGSCRHRRKQLSDEIAAVDRDGTGLLSL